MTDDKHEPKCIDLCTECEQLRVAAAKGLFALCVVLHDAPDSLHDDTIENINEAVDLLRKALQPLRHDLIQLERLDEDGDSGNPFTRWLLDELALAFGVAPELFDTNEDT